MEDDRSMRVFAKGSLYQLNVSNTVIGRAYEYYITANKIKRPMSDKQRIQWESELWEYFRKIYYSCIRRQLPVYPKDSRIRLSDLVRGGQYEQLSHIINYRIVPEKMIEKLYKNLSSQAYAHVFSANFAADCVKNACRATARLRIFALSSSKLCSKIRTHIL